MLHVRQIGDEILHTPPSKAGFIQHNLLQGYITTLQETENLYGGVGIACNQCAKISDPLQKFFQVVLMMRKHVR